MKKSNKFILILYSLMTILIIYFLFIPILGVIVNGIKLDEDSLISMKYFNRALFHLKHSLFVAITVTFLATLIGLIMSFTLRRIEFRGRRVLRIAALLPLINPPFVGSIAFIMLFGRRGLITHEIFGLSISPYGWQGIVFIQVLGLGALANILISSSIQKIDTSLEEAARNLGASETKVFLTVTLPMMIPEISNTGLLIFLAAMADFGTPLIIGGSFQTLASDIYIQVTGVYDMHAASISGIILLIPCVFAFMLQRYYVQKSTFFTDYDLSEDIEYRQVKPALRRVLIFITIAFIGLVVLKYTFIIIGAFTNQWGHDYTLTLDHVKTILERDLTPFINSVKLATFVALCASFLGVLLAYLLHNKKLYLKGLVDFMAVLPAAVPGILFGIGYLVTFKYPMFGIGKWIFKEQTPFILLGTGIIIYIISIARYLNVGLRSGYALLEHLNPDLENAAYNLGSGEIRTFFNVMMPLLKDAFFASFFKNFATTMTTLGAIIFLLLPKNKVAVQQIFQIITSSAMGEAAAMSLLLSFLCLVLLGCFYLIFYGKTIWGVWKVRVNKWR